MIISKTILVYITFIIIISVFVANVTNLISVDTRHDSLHERNSKNSSDNRRNRTFPKLSNKEEHLIWFLQISDIHISKFQDISRITELQEFCDVTVSAIRPKVVLASGDLTDAKTKDHIGSKQFEEEWMNYRNILRKCEVESKTTWLDIRGNHDNFNVASINSHENYFLNYSMQGSKHKRSYIHEVKVDGDLYTFVALDATLDPGPRRPFNFVGILDDKEQAEITKIVDQSIIRGSKYLIWFGHFPTSCILTSSAHGVRPLIGQYPQSMVYVCGHLHQLGGLVTNMYTLQHSGFLELELSDWKDNRMIRLMAIDHGFFSFVDVKHGVWPIILVTNPKHTLYMMPTKESKSTIVNSTHIRVLAFSLAPIDRVAVQIDDQHWQECDRVKGPLFVVKWDSKRYMHGIHTITVNAKDIYGRTRTIQQPFAMDDSRLNFNILARIALMTNASTVFQFFFGLLVFMCVMPLCTLRYVHKLVKEKKLRKPLPRKSCVTHMLRKFWVLVTVDRIFYPLVLYPFYLTVGPWSAGYIIEEHFGVIFAWGIFVKNAYLPGSFTYAYGFIQLFLFQIPFMFIMANCVDYRIYYVTNQLRPVKKWSYICLFHFPFILTLTIQIVFAYFFWLAYGTMAFFLGPLRTWTIIYATILYVCALNLPERCCREATMVWYPKAKSDTTDDEQDEQETEIITNSSI